MTIPANAKQLTVESYNQHAAVLAERYDKLDRRADIDRIFESLTKPKPFVFEIGCGSGRDAKEFLKRTPNYMGLDISEALLTIARKNIPETTFVHGDIETFALPTDIDLAYSSASLLHIDKEALRSVLKRLYEKLTLNGLIYLSLKEATEYREEIQVDAFGTRIFYHYSLQDIEELSSEFKILKLQHYKHERDLIWLEVLLQKT